MNGIITGKFYNIQNAANNKMLNIYAGRTANGTNVCLWEADNSTEQKWRLESCEGTHYLYTAVDATKVLDFYAGQTNYANADIWQANDPTNQNIIIIKVAPTQYKIALAVNPNLILTAKGNQNNSNVVWEADQGTDLQIWDFIPVSPFIYEGLDTAVPCSEDTIALIDKHSNIYDFICRYYCANRTAQKILTLSEALKISPYLNIISIYQDANNEPEHFNYDIGKSDAEHALDYALNIIGQPLGSAIYFAVDFNPTANTVNSKITSYFEGINKVFLANQYPYYIGVYGSGLVCQTIKQNTNLAEYSWLAQSTAYFGTSEYNDPHKYNIRQSCHVEINNVVFDSNSSGVENNFGQWRFK